MQTTRPETKQQIQTSSVRHLNIYTYKPVKRKQQKCEQQDQQQKQQMQTSSVRHLSFLTPCRFNANKETKTTNARSKCSPLKRLRIQTCKKKKTITTTKMQTTRSETKIINANIKCSSCRF
jgi:CBS-domain-containing membrane protein